MMSLKTFKVITRALVQCRGRFCTALFSLLLAASLYSFGQEATILGTVTDSSGAAVPNVAIAITRVETGETRSSATNDTGQYVAPGLPIGHYNVSTKAAGFSSAERNNIILNVDDRSRVDFVLKVGAAQERVEVEANAVAVQSDSSEVSTVITGQQVAELGTNGRSIYSLYALTPGASSIQADLITPTAVSGDSNVSVNGQRPGHNLQLLDGSENLDRGGSSASVMPSIDAIQEFRSLTSNYSAEYGLTSAATITNVIKAGGKQFHASAWEFGRNDALDARNYFNPAPMKVAELRFNVYGFNAGGQVPLWKEHPTFFFYNMEWRSIVQGGLTNQVVPPTSAYPDAGGAGTGAVLPVAIDVPSAAQLSPAQIARFASAGLVPGQPFPNNTIPDSLLDPNAQALLNAGIFPANNSTDVNGNPTFRGGNNSPTTVREEIARVDHQFTPKFSVFGHWVSEQVSQTYGTTQWSDDNVPTVSDIFGNPSYSAVVHTTYVISPTLLNEASFNYNGNRINIIPQGVVSNPTSDPFTFNRLFTGPNQDTRLPGVYLNGSTGTTYTSNWTPWINKADDYQLRDDLSWTKGAHQLKFGFSWALYKKVQDYFADTQGTFKFNGSYTGNDFADFLLGYAQQYEEDAIKSSGHWNNVSWASYVQDNWRVNHRLTLNLGLRWDGAPHTYEANQQSANFYPNLYNQASRATFDSNGNICSVNSVPACPGGPSPGLGTSPNPILNGLQFYENGIGIGGVGGIPKGLTNNYWAEFGPRIGFAYDLTGQGKTVIRGGFGILYDRIQGNDMYNGATNTPFDASPTLHNVLLANPGTNIGGTGNTISAADLPVLPVGLTGIALHYHPPTNYQYSLGVQQALGARAVLGLSYVGSQARYLNDYRAINLPAIADLPALVTAGGAGLNQDPTLTYPGYGGIRLSEDEGNSHYNSFQVDLHGNVRRDLQLQFGYTLARAVDATTSNGSGGDLNNLTNPYAGWKYDSGPSPFDRTNVAFVNYVYQLPFFKNSDNHLLRSTVGGWELSGIVTMESGAPLNIGLSGGNPSQHNQNASNVLANTSDRPDISGKVSYPNTVAAWFGTSNFSFPVCATGPDCYGNLGHDVVRGPGRDNWNLSLNKNFVISEARGSRVEFRAETFNTWNHTQFEGDYNNTGIGTNFGATNFGIVNHAFDPRVFQLALKLFF
jgi:Carboxypeptidase regulatory-like domain